MPLFLLCSPVCLFTSVNQSSRLSAERSARNPKAHEQHLHPPTADASSSLGLNPARLSCPSVVGPTCLLLNTRSVVPSSRSCVWVPES
jgi:hypothetical protein